MKLTDTQAIVLSLAAQRDDLNALPLPGHLRGGAAIKVITPLLEAGLLAEAEAGYGQSHWRDNDAGEPMTLVVTDAGLAALGLEPLGAPQAATDGQEATDAPGMGDEAASPPTAATGPVTRKPRSGTKQALLIEMLQRPNGATIAEIVAATGWQSHTARGAMAGALKKRLGLVIASEKDEARGRVYRIV